MAGKRILVLDENPANRKFLINALEDRQFQTLEAPSAKEALIAAWRDEPDLVLFEPVLSDLRDDEFISKVRTNQRTKNTPLVALSSDPHPARREACLQAGVNEYIVKSSQALSTLEAALSRIFGAATPAPDEQSGRETGLLMVFLSAKGGTGTSSLCANIALIVSTDHSTVKLTRTVNEYLQSQGSDRQKIYLILNRAVGLEGVTKTEAEEILGLPIKTTIPYLGRISRLPIT